MEGGKSVNQGRNLEMEVSHRGTPLKGGSSPRNLGRVSLSMAAPPSLSLTLYLSLLQAEPLLPQLLFNPQVHVLYNPAILAACFLGSLGSLGSWFLSCFPPLSFLLFPLVLPPSISFQVQVQSGSFQKPLAVVALTSTINLLNYTLERS